MQSMRCDLQYEQPACLDCLCTHAQCSLCNDNGLGNGGHGGGGQVIFSRWLKADHGALKGMVVEWLLVAASL